jgi:hypothetical protein
MEYSAKAPQSMTCYTDETNTGAPMVPLKTDDSTPSSLNEETLEETVFSHRL